MGEHLKRRRIELGLLHKEAACQMHVAVETVIAWEKDRKDPEHRNWPRIISFLGYDPYPDPRTLGERLRARSRQLGLSRREASHRLGMDENTLAAYETGRGAPRGLAI